ncbi:MAG: hypothetical protein P4M12_10225 [Gammaproteobacteria bacterium]|nr:hypothetical protein [Gammaproteobacteria bacterium]
MSQERNPKHNDLYQQIMATKDNIFASTKDYSSDDPITTKELIKSCEIVFEKCEEYLKEFPEVLEIEQLKERAKNTLLIMIYSDKADKLSPLISKIVEKLPKDADNLYRLTSNAIDYLTESRKLIRDYNFFSMFFLETLKKSINVKIYRFADLHRKSLVSLLATKAKNYSESKIYVDELIKYNNLIKTCRDNINLVDQAVHLQEANNANLDAIRYLYSLENLKEADVIENNKMKNDENAKKDVKGKENKKANKIQNVNAPTLFSNSDNQRVKSADELIDEIKKMSISKKSS